MLVPCHLHSTADIPQHPICVYHSPEVLLQLFCAGVLFNTNVLNQYYKLLFSITRFVKKVNPEASDTIVLLGDVGANYFGGRKDKRLKEKLNSLGVQFLCIHGNHEMRPTSVPGYQDQKWNGGIVRVQPEFPNLVCLLLVY